MIEFALPDVGEGLTEAEILSWHVVVGDTVEINDTLVEIETAKSVVELPSPAAGVIAAMHINEGQTADVGTVIVSIQDDVAIVGGTAGTAIEDSAPTEDKPLVLVGTGPTASIPRRKRLSARRQVDVSTSGPLSARVDGPVRAKPPVRLLAKRLGIELSSVAPSRDGMITRGDVERAVTSPNLPSRDSRETRVPIKGVRKATAAAMTTSAFTAPHVTLWLTVDVTRSMELLARLKQDRAWDGVRLTPLVLVARAFLLAIRRHPDINSRWDEAAQEIVLLHPVNLGIAAATPRGLMVPNIKDADQLDLRGLADAMDSLVQTARGGKTQPEDMAAGTITITNIGALGVDAGTPILNPGEAAILAFGSVRELPWVVEGQVVPRKVTQLAMSFDHRLVDGELGSQVLTALGHLLGDPGAAFTCM